MFPEAAPWQGRRQQFTQGNRRHCALAGHTSLPSASVFAHGCFAPSLKMQAVVSLAVWRGGRRIYGDICANTRIHTKMLDHWLPRALDADVQPICLGLTYLFSSLVSQNRQQIPEKSQKKKKKTKWRGDRATGSHKLQCVIL